MNKEIGGYLELETMRGASWHTGTALNCGRNCLRLVLRERQISRLYLPYYLCDAVFQACKDENCEIVRYHVNAQFLPPMDALPKEAYVYVVNYYGFLDNETISALHRCHRNLIVDNTHAFFQEPIEGCDTIYCCRKFFGVPDGAYLYSDIAIPDLPVDDTSTQRMAHLTGRKERTAREYYPVFRRADASLDHAPIRRVSPVTESLLRGIDYGEVQRQRETNFDVLMQLLGDQNEIAMKQVPRGAFAYPFCCRNTGDARAKLAQRGVYIPTLWPNVLESADVSEWERRAAADVLPLPCDQRYSIADMRYLAEQVMDAIREC